MSGMRRDVQKSGVLENRTGVATWRLSVLSMLCTLSTTTDKMRETQDKSSRSALGEEEQSFHFDV